MKAYIKRETVITIFVFPLSLSVQTIRHIRNTFTCSILYPKPAKQLTLKRKRLTDGRGRRSASGNLPSERHRYSESADPGRPLWGRTIAQFRSAAQCNHTKSGLQVYGTHYPSVAFQNPQNIRNRHCTDPVKCLIRQTRNMGCKNKVRGIAERESLFCTERLTFKYIQRGAT